MADTDALGAEVQTRDTAGELRYFRHVEDAFRYADQNPWVWKVSWARERIIGGRKVIVRYRFVRTVEGKPGNWREQPLTEIIDAVVEGRDSNSYGEDDGE